MQDVLLFGLETVLAEDLGRALSRHTHRVRTLACDRAGLIFTDLPSLPEAKRRWPEVPVIVVNRAGDWSGWIDALEGGAVDCCAPPFDDVQMRWLLHAKLKKKYGIKGKAA